MSADLYATAALPQHRPSALPGGFAATATAAATAAAPAPAPLPQERPQRRLRALERPAPGAVRRPRLVYGLIAVGGAVAIAAAQMGLSILTTQSSYEMKTLTQQQRELDWQRQILEDDLAGLSSPQYLAANAASKGMVTGQMPSYLRLSDAAVIGQGKAASGTSSISALAKAAVDNALVATTPLVTNPSRSITGGIAPTAPPADAASDVDVLNASGAPGATGAAGAADATTPPVESTTPPAITDGLPTPDTH